MTSGATLEPALMTSAEPGRQDPYHALVIEDDPQWQEFHRAILEPMGYRIETARTFARACGLVKNRLYDVAILDLRLYSSEQPDNRDGVFLLPWLIRKGVPVIIVTAVAARRLVDEIFQSYEHVYAILDKSDSDSIAELTTCVEKARLIPLPDVEDDPARSRELAEHFDHLIADMIGHSRTQGEADRVGGLALQGQASLSNMTWLHISDLHLRDDPTQRLSTVLEALLEDIEEQIHERNLVLDWIAVTGDVAYSGRKDQYELAERFFESLLDKTGLTKDRILVVPGNHDVDRTLISPGARILGDSLQDGETISAILGNSGDRKLLLRRFGGYGRFVRSYFEGHLPFDNRHYFYVRRFQVAGCRIAFLGLNSAWVSASDSDRTSGLVVGEEQVRVALKQAGKTDICIALLHHPFRMLRESEQQTVESLLCQDCHFILHGHGHRTGISLQRSPDTCAMIIAAGSSYAGREYPNTYNFVRFDPANSRGEIILRRWSGEGAGFWTIDSATYRNVENGVYDFTL